MQCLDALLAELQAEFSREPDASGSPGSFSVITESNVRRVHEALWGLRVYFGLPGPDALSETSRAIQAAAASLDLRAKLEAEGRTRWSDADDQSNGTVHETLDAEVPVPKASARQRNDGANIAHMDGGELPEMSKNTAFWDDLARDLKDPEFLREYVVESIRIAHIRRGVALTYGAGAGVNAR